MSEDLAPPRLGAPSALIHLTLTRVLMAAMASVRLASAFLRGRTSRTTDRHRRTPDSAIVGISGNSGRRVLPQTATSLPADIFLRRGQFTVVTCTRPARTSNSAGAAPERARLG